MNCSGCGLEINGPADVKGNYIFHQGGACYRLSIAKEYKLHHECPKCNTKGTLFGAPIYESVVDELATGYGGMFAAPVYKQVIAGYEKPSKCSLCDGHGYLSKAPIAVTQIIDFVRG